MIKDTKLTRLIGGVLFSIFVGVVFYYFCYGLILTGTMAKIPFLSVLFQGILPFQMVWLSIAVGILYFAMNYLSKMLSSIFAFAFLLLVFIWVYKEMPDVSTFINNIAQNIKSAF